MSAALTVLTLAVLALAVAAIAAAPLILWFTHTWRRARTDEPVLALTIDDGPDALCEPLLSLLTQRGVTATWFLIGDKARRAPELLQAIRDAGHQIGNHTMHHPHALGFYSAAACESEWADAQAVLGPTRFARAVAGVASPPVVRAARAQGLRLVGWTASARDGGPLRVQAATALRRLRRGLRPGGILTVHDRAGQDTVETVRLLLDLAEKRGFRWVSLDELERCETHIEQRR